MANEIFCHTLIVYLLACYCDFENGVTWQLILVPRGSMMSMLAIKIMGHIPVMN